jgi:predicted peroxiredoxin
MVSMGLKEDIFVKGIKILRMAEFLEIAKESDVQLVIG